MKESLELEYFFLLDTVVDDYWKIRNGKYDPNKLEKK